MMAAVAKTAERMSNTMLIVARSVGVI